MPDPADQVAAKLAGIRQRAAYSAIAALDPAAPGAHARDSAADVPVLLAVAEAVLKYAAKWDSPTPQPDDTMNVRQDCGVKLRQAISRALLGKEAADAG